MTVVGICLLAVLAGTVFGGCCILMSMSIRTSLDVPHTKTDKQEQLRIRMSGLLTLIPFFSIIGGLSVLIFLILNGLRVLFRAVLFFAVKEEGERFVLTVLDSGRTKAGSIISLLFLFLLFLSVLMFFLLANTLRRWSFFQTLQEYLWRIFLRIRTFLESFLRYRKKKNPPRRRYGRPDNQRKTQNAWIVPYTPPDNAADSYENFLRQLSRIPDADTQIGYAYRTICRLYKRKGVALKLSDTPHEIVRAVRRSGKFREEEADVIRDAVEAVKFRETVLTEKQKKDILNTLCIAVQRYMG